MIYAFPKDSADPDAVRRCGVLARGASLLIVMVGAVVLLGWMLHVPIVTSVLPGSVTMKPNTALCFVLAGLSLWLSRAPGGSEGLNPYRLRAGRLLAGLVVFIGGLTVSEYLFGVDFGIDEWLLRDAGAMAASQPGRMAPATALIFFIEGSAIVFLNVEWRRSWRPAEWLASFGMVAGIIGLLGYVYGGAAPFRLAIYGSLAIHTAVLFIALGVGTLCARPDRGLMAAFTSTHSGGMLARRVTPLAATLPFFVGWLRLKGQHAGLYGTEFGQALYVTSNIVLFGALICIGAGMLNRLDAKRTETAESLRQTAASLDLRARELEESGRRFRFLADNMPQLIWTSSPDGNLDYYNRRWYDYSGMTFEQAKDCGWRAIVHPDDLENCVNCWTTALTTGCDYEVEHRLRRAADGEYRWHLGRAFPLRDARGEIVQWVGTSTDIEDQKRARVALERHVEERTAELAAANASLAEKQQFLEVLLNNLQVGIVACDAEGNLTMQNRFAREFNALPAEGPVVSIPFDERPVRYGLYYADGRERMRPEDMPMHRALHGESVREFEYIIMPPGGVRRVVVASAQPITAPDGLKLGAVVAIHDVSERRAAVQRLRESEERFRQAFEFAGAGMAIVGLDGEWLKVNRVICEITGYPEPELLKKTFQDITHPEDVAADLGHVRELLENKARYFQMEKRYIRRDGGIVWIHLTSSLVRDEAGAPLHFISQVEDITARKRAEEALRESEERFRDLFENASDMIQSTAPDGRFLFVNRAWSETMGYSDAELQGLRVFDIVHPDHREEWATAFRRVILGENLTNVETAFIARDGRKILVEGNAHCQFRGRMPVGMRGIFRDCTERRRGEVELRAAKESAEAANRAKSRFLANISHEIRTPMNGVIGMTSLLLDTPLNEDQRDYAGTIRASAENLLTVINDILDFSKVEAGKIALETLDFDAQDVLEDTLELLAEAAQSKGIELAGRIAPDAPRRFRGDAGRLRQVLTNLVGNAIKFTAGGEVAVRVDVADETDSQATLTFRVRDTGIGIDPAKQAGLFEAFSQADASTTRKFGGTGLGLAISKQLVELMGGRIGVESAPGQGSTFWFSLPMQKQSEPSPGSESEHALIGARALIVDDNATSAECLQAQFAAWNIPSVCAANGGEALERLRGAAGQGDAFTTAILDLSMPGMDGLALARAITADEKLAAVQLILLTARGERLSEREWRAAGITQCCAKPVRQSALFDCLANTTARGAAPSCGPAVLSEFAAAPGARLILVVEDNPVNQKVALGQLRKLGYAADAVGNGFEALEALDRVPYDIVLMDCQMPEMDGYEASAAIRQRERAGQHTWIVAMTANAMREDRELCLAAGMDDYVSKPVRMADLAAALERAPLSAAEPLAVDPRSISQLRELFGEDDEDHFERLVALFREDAPHSLAELDAAAARGDGRSIMRLAHTVKGSAAYFGARPFQELCGKMELAGGAGNIDAIPGLLAATEHELKRVLTALDTELLCQTQ
jgi:PAS domain S-box-containing protein